MRTLWIALAATLLLPSGSAVSQEEATARFEVVFDRVQRTRNLAAEVGEPFSAWVLAHDVEGGLRGWELQVTVEPPLILDDAAIRLRALIGDSPLPGQVQTGRHGGALRRPPRSRARPDRTLAEGRAGLE